MADRGCAILGIPNYVGQDYSIVTQSEPSNYEPVGMEMSWLKTEEPSEIGRISTLNPDHTQIFCTFGTNQASITARSLILRTIDGFALINHNLSPNGMWRVLGRNATAPITYGQLQANATGITASSNITGTHNDIDEALEASGVDYIGPTNVTLPWSVTLSIPTIGGQSPLPGEAFCYFVAKVELFANGSGATDIITLPHFQVELLESGVVKSTLYSKAVTGTGNSDIRNFPSNPVQFLIFPFDASVISNPFNIQVRITCSIGVSALDNTYCKLNVLKFLYETTPKNPDTGWLPNSAGTWSSDEDGPAPQQSVEFFPDDPWTVSSFAVLLLDDQAMPNPLENSSTVATQAGVPIGAILYSPQGYLDVGTLVAGAAEFVSLETVGVTRIRVQSSGAGRSLGGQSYGADLYRYREFESFKMTVTHEQGLRLMDKLGWRKGKANAVYLCEFPDMPHPYRQFTSAWVTISESGDMSMESVPGGLVRSSHPGTSKFQITAGFTEKV